MSNQSFALDGIRSGSIGIVVQILNETDVTVSTGTTQIPSDTSVPQNTEGDEYMTLAITPRSTANILKIDVSLQLSHGASTTHMTAALFQDSTAGALKASSFYSPVATAQLTIAFTHYMVAGIDTETTFKIRCGGSTAGTTTVAGKHGAAANSTITITEYKV